jgi:hypothetical protein
VNALTGVVPGDGFLDIEIVSSQPTEDGGNFALDGGSNFQVTLAAESGSSSATPEPGTLAPVGLALAGALAWSRKRRK